MAANGNHNASMQHYQQQVRAERSLPTVGEVSSYIYSSYTGGEVISKVESLQKKYPSLRPFIYASSIMALFPLFIFTQTILLIFSVNIIMGLFVLNAFRFVSSIPLVKQISDNLYNMFGNSKTNSKKPNESKDDNEEYVGPKTINAGLDDIMKEADNIIRGVTDQLLRRSQSADKDSNSARYSGSVPSELYKALSASYNEIRKIGVLSFFRKYSGLYDFGSSARDGRNQEQNHNYVSYAKVVKEEDVSKDESDSYASTLKQEDNHNENKSSNEEFESYADALKEGEPGDAHDYNRTN